MSIKNKLAAVACGLALVGTVAAPMAALADTADGASNVTLKTSSEQIKFSAPTVIPFSVSSDGSLLIADSSALKIVNQSIIPIHTTKMTVKGQNGFTVGDTSAAGAEDTLNFTVNGVKASDATGESGADFVHDLSYAGSGKDSLALEITDGKVSSVTKDLTQTTTAAYIKWTVASGKSTDN